jgi:hypothetical protein
VDCFPGHGTAPAIFSTASVLPPGFAHILFRFVRDHFTRFDLQIDALQDFLAANSGAGTKSFRLIGSNNPNDFLGAPEGTLDILCVTPPKQQQAKPDDFGKPEVVKPRNFFAVRKNVEDLVYAQTDQQFKRLERANLSFKYDL